MRLLTLTAAVLSVALAAPSAQALSLSSISSLLSNYGVNVTLPNREINLPLRAEAAVTKALDRAESVLDRLFGEGGPLAEIDFPDLDLSHVNLPEIILPGFPEIEHPDIEEILDNARATVAEARAKARARIDVALDKVADRIDSVRDRLEERFPDYELPSYELPGNLQDLIDRARGVLDDVLDDETPSVSSLLTSASVESQPIVVEPNLAVQSLQMASTSVDYFSLPLTASVTIPEPASALLGAAGVVLAGVARRRR